MFHYSSRSRDYDKQIRDLEDLIRPAQLVPETHGIDTLFTQMQHQKSHMAIVLDEYGQTSGIVSMEDILEEIVGNIQDEHDDEEDSIERIRDDVFRMNGHTPLEEASEELGITFEEEGISTLNGFIYSRIDRIPEEHTSFSVEAYGYEFRVLDVEDRMVQDMIVRRVAESEDAEEQH